MMTKTKADKYPQRVRNELRFRELTVLRVERAGAAFQRIVLGGEALEGFASHGFDDHTKVFFPAPGTTFVPPVVTDEGIDWGDGVLYDRSRVWAEQQQMVASGLLRPEIALAWYYDLPAETEADLQAVREKYMPAAKGGENHE